MHTPTEISLSVKSPSLEQILDKAAEIIQQKYARQGSFESATATKEFLKLKLAKYEREVFAVMLLDSQHRLIRFEELFYGTVNAASVYPREIVKVALKANAAAVIFAHNHPSGVAEPSTSDKAITKRLVEALALVDVNVLDHVVVGYDTVSFAECGWL